MPRKATTGAASALGDPDTRADLVALVGERPVVVVVGSGGVGKTTVSAALAMGLVERDDRRVMVLTVDPARRLATALGIGAIGSDPVTVPPQRLRAAGLRPRGELVAAMLDQKSAWDRMVERYAPSRQSAEKILGNSFYKGISNAFVGSHEYIAMEALYELHVGREYDTLVIDTPPSRNALDFLDAPTRMGDFVGARFLSWLARPSRVGWRALNVAATPFLRISDRLLGSDVLGELAEFVGEIQGLYAGVQARAKDVYRLLRSKETAFAVVTTLEPAPFAEAEFFADRLRDYGMPLRALVVNRTLPPALIDPGAIAAARFLVEHEMEAAAVLDAAGGVRVGGEATRRLGESFQTLARLAALEERQLGRLGGMGRLATVHLPLADRELVDITGLAQLTRGLGGAWMPHAASK